MVIKLRSKDKKARYDGDIDKHCHLICKNCGRIIDIFDTREISITSKRIKESGFAICLEHLEIHGMCKECRLKPKKNDDC
ncbi:transcriptional repressor [Patescibacteria group bacterium]|nr:transcriptional repressor [Patescibacteria group bacterium]